MYLARKSCLIFGLSLISGLSLILGDNYLNANKVQAGEADMRMGKVYGSDNFKYEGFEHSEQKIWQLIRKAKSFEAAKKFEQANQIYSELIDIIPHSATLHYFRGLNSLSMQNTASALNDLESASEKFKEQGNHNFARMIDKMLEKAEKGELDDGLPVVE